jgi:hypothetical protein
MAVTAVVCWTLHPVTAEYYQKKKKKKEQEELR